MKIRQLKFKNINSFYGEHAPINFHEEPLGSAGLFMICGPTGAGKSTLLDVITLALFNEVPRIGRISKQEIENRGLLINSKACAERLTDAFAEVEYEVENVLYRSKWSIRKNRNGKWNDYEMEVAILPEGKILESKKSDVPKKNTEIIKLEYKQFVQSIILAQGSFAKFLQANRNDRAKLLEDITGTHLYRQLGVASHLRYNEATNALKAKQDQIQELTFLSDEEQLLLEEECKSLQENLTKIDEEIKGWNQEISLARKATEYNQQLQRIVVLQERNNASILAFTPQKRQIDQHESVVEFVKELTIIDQQQSRKVHLEQQLAQIRTRIHESEQKRSLILKQASTLIKEQIQEEQLDNQLNQFAARVIHLQQFIQQRQDNVLQHKTAIINDIQNHTFSYTSQLSSGTLQDNLRLLAQEKERIQSVLKEFPDQFNSDEQIEALATKQARINDLLKRQQESERITNIGITKKKDKESLEQDLQSTRAQIEQVRIELIKLEQLLEQHKIKRDQDYTRQSLKELRATLQPGSPCPLCGSVDHPTPLEHFVSTLLELNEQIKHCETLQVAKRKEELQLKNQETQIITKIDSLTEQLKQLRGELAGHRQEIQVAKVELSITTEDIHEQLNLIVKQKKAIAEWREARESNLFIQRVEPIYTAIEQLQTQIIEHQNQLNQLYQGSHIQRDIDTLKQQWHHTNTDLTNTRNTLTDLVRELKELEDLMQVMQLQVQEKLSLKGISSIEDAKNRLLQQHIYQSLVQEKDQLAAQQVSLTDQYEQTSTLLRETVSLRKMSQQTLQELETEIANLQYKRDGIIRDETEKRALLRSNEETKKKFESVQLELQSLQKELRKWELLKNYIGDANGNKFNNFAQNLTLANLISLANNRLRTLSERYVLTKLPEDPDHLYVYDTYQGHTTRSVDTLSGGETFTLSLALALALSDMASRNVRIDSLFIDEGFGTLDDETLDTAIYSLEKLQNENLKTVGVISHRNEMKERIPVQIQIDKGLEGCSNISIVCK